jgi:hypothetical protein
MSELIIALENARDYIDVLLVVFKDNFGNLDLSGVGLKVNSTKSHLSRYELEYLGCLMNIKELRPTIEKLEAIINAYSHTKNLKPVEKLLWDDLLLSQ